MVSGIFSKAGKPGWGGSGDSPELGRHLRDVAQLVDSLAATPERWKSGTLLLVEDEPLLLELMQEFLVDAGHRLLTAGSGVEAQAILREEGALLDAIVLDRRMPDMDGMQLLAWWRDQLGSESVPVIMQTAAASPVDVMEGMQAGAWCYITKPYRKAQFNAYIQAAIAWRRNRE